mmetsp:Transcript_55917/g.133261  ORF Transcript_55917/g.133261 Transcript_55917/m.133261 type:complete len:102 (+) Transcript_55917:213-518(+)
MALHWDSSPGTSNDPVELGSFEKLPSLPPVSGGGDSEHLSGGLVHGQSTVRIEAEKNHDCCTPAVGVMVLQQLVPWTLVVVGAPVTGVATGVAAHAAAPVV